MPTQSIPLTCPHCGGAVIHEHGYALWCRDCWHDIPLGPPVPTEAERLRAAVLAVTHDPPPPPALSLMGTSSQQAALRAGWHAAMAAVRKVLEETP